jgi:Spy/CpxP family protein refolding chaperone
MKKLFNTLLLVTVLAAGAQAQEKQAIKGQRSETARKHLRHQKMDAMKQLNLSQAQKDQLKAIREDSRKQVDALKANRQLTLQQYDEKRSAIVREQKAKADAVLTSEQKNKLEQIKAEKEQKREASFNKRMDGMQAKLGLSAQQTQQLKSIHDNHDARAKAIHNDPKMTIDQKKDAMRNLQQSTKAEREKVLTDEQRQKMQAMKGERRQKAFKEDHLRK